MAEVKPSPPMSSLQSLANATSMNAAIPINSDAPRENLFSAADIDEILREHGWLNTNVAQDGACERWASRAAFLLGPQAADRAELAKLLALVFNYDASEILRTTVSHAVLSREGARDVIRELALAVLEGPRCRFRALQSNHYRNKIARAIYRTRIILSRAAGVSGTSRRWRIGSRNPVAR